MENSVQTPANSALKFPTFFWRITSSHMITYFVMGVIAAFSLNYRELFDSGPFSCLMRPFDSQWIAAGPMLQVVRGLIFSMALWYFKEVFLFEKYGWLKLWILLVGLSILSTAGATSGSIEGMIYTKIPIGDQMIGYLEVMPQTLFFSIIVYYWYKNPGPVWNIVMGILVGLIVFFGVMGLVIPPEAARFLEN